MTTVTGATALRAGIQRLAEAGVPDPARDARLLLAHAWGVAPDRLTLSLPDPLPDDAALRFDAALARRAARVPVSQIIGYRAFWGRDFIVTPDVLDPRPETETLIALALGCPFARLLDLGTGSGAIAVTLLAERPQARGVATDLSPAALTVAARNAAALGVGDRLALHHADWFDGITGTFDLIVSNPPYIDAAEVESLSPEVRVHEPRMALTPGPDGLAPYRVLAAQAPAHLAPGGRLIVEIGPTQGAAVAGFLRDAGFSAVSVHTDLDGRDRCVQGQWAEKP